MNLNGWVFRTNLVLLKINRIEKAFSNVVSAERGYLLTEEEQSLDPYNYAVKTYPVLCDELIQQVSDNPSQVNNAKTICINFDKWIEYGNGVITLNREKGNAAARKVVLQGHGQKMADELLEKIESFRQTEENLRNQRVESQHQFVRISMAIAMFLSLIFGALIAVFGRRQLLGLSKSYQEILEQQRLQNESLQAQNWIKTGQSELVQIMAGDQPVVNLADKVLKYISTYLNAKVAAFYVANEQKEFELKAAFSYPISKSTLPSFKYGETMLGQAAKEGKIAVTQHLPSSYFKVASGLGEMPPSNIVIVPISYNKEVNSVLELGFLEEVDSVKMEWLKQVVENVGVSIKTAKYKEHLEVLLEEVQNQAEELQSQQEELRVSNEELEEQAKILRETQSRLESQHAELEQTNAQLEEQAQALESQADALNEKNFDLNRAQDELQAKADELEKASQYKSEFLANMSHELRTPLNSSLILAKLLADNKNKNLSSQQVEYAEQILNSGNDLLNLINDILDLSKVEAGKLEISPDDVPIEKFVVDIKKMFEPLAKEKDLSFITKIEDGVPQTIFTDSLRLEQVVKNLLSNAIKFTQKGRVELKISKSKDSADCIDISVLDTGIGIEEGKQDVIFEAFRQADGTTNRMFGGTGLGLSISKNLIKLLGGDIKVESSLGKGSAFTISVPIKFTEARSTELEKPKQEFRKIESPKMHSNNKQTRKQFMEDDRDNITQDSNIVLIIEDDPVFAKILCHIAKELNFHCVITDLASEAYDLAQTIKPHAILLDIKLPDHSGLVVLDQLKQNTKTRHIPVHVLSGMDFIKDALEMGAVGYALKPAKESEIKKIFELLQNKISESMQKVLIIEDDKTQREAIRHLIRNDKIQTFAAENGRDALKLLETEQFNCVIVDLNLPDMTGFELLEKISKVTGEQNLPVIVYTGRDLSSAEEDNLRKYSKSVIVKGAKSPDRLLSEVTLFLHQVESKLDPDRQKMLEDLRSREKIFDSKKILIVDDDMRNVFALTAALENKGAKIVIAKNGQEALDKLDLEKMDIVLMDIMMPVMDGYKAMEEIRKQNKFANLPIIALTAKAMKDDRERCIKAGANDYLAKPIDVEKLMSLIRIWISQGGR